MQATSFGWPNLLNRGDHNEIIKTPQRNNKAISQAPYFQVIDFYLNYINKLMFMSKTHLQIENINFKSVENIKTLNQGGIMNILNQAIQGGNINTQSRFRRAQTVYCFFHYINR